MWFTKILPHLIFVSLEFGEVSNLRTNYAEIYLEGRKAKNYFSYLKKLIQPTDKPIGMGFFLAQVLSESRIFH